MARKHEAEQHLRDGLSPSDIASRMGITVSSVIQYLRTRVGEGALRFSDIYFAIPADKRDLLQMALAQRDEQGSIPQHEMQSKNLTREELDLFDSLRTHRVFAGDMYEYISDVELTLHSWVRRTLENEFGAGELEWWRNGIPSGIRSKCAARREEDEDPSDEVFAYTDLIDLAKIVNKHWELFRGMLPKEYSQNRKHLDRDFARLNRIRNAVMHPVKQRKWSEDDFQFVRTFRSKLPNTN